MSFPCANESALNRYLKQQDMEEALEEAIEQRMTELMSEDDELNPHKLAGVSDALGWISDEFIEQKMIPAIVAEDDAALGKAIRENIVAKLTKDARLQAECEIETP